MTPIRRCAHFQTPYGNLILCRLFKNGLRPCQNLLLRVGGGAKVWRAVERGNKQIGTSSSSVLLLLMSNCVRLGGRRFGANVLIVSAIIRQQQLSSFPLLQHGRRRLDIRILAAGAYGIQHLKLDCRREPGNKWLPYLLASRTFLSFSIVQLRKPTKRRGGQVKWATFWPIP